MLHGMAAVGDPIPDRDPGAARDEPLPCDAAMAAGRRLRRQAACVAVAGNLVGGVVTSVYFNVVDIDVAGVNQGRAMTSIVYFVVMFTLLSAAFVVTIRRGMRPLVNADAGADDRARRCLLMTPFRVAAFAMLGWVAAGIVWGIVGPMLFGHFSPARAVRVIFGTTVIAGSVTTAFIFLLTERFGRRALPAFFPSGELGTPAGVVPLTVQTRLVAAFVLGGIVPLLVMGAVSYHGAAALLIAEPTAAAALVDRMLVVIVFVAAVGTLAALGLSTFTARSVGAPLRVVADAMKGVAHGRLDVRCPVTGTDEIGTVTDGFNRMVRGLREREAIREAFGKYVTREIRDEILAGRVTLEGEVVDVTVLFVDIRDFTPWVEASDPREVVRDLNAYFTRMEEAVRAHHGLVLQFIGDEIEAVFGAPVRRTDHADLAVAAALDMRRHLTAWNGERVAAGRSAVRHGIGIHTGRVLAGNVGSPTRVAYALVGDAVNLASRIQEGTKDVGVDILISDATRRRLTSAPPLRQLPALRVKGKSVGIDVHTVAEDAAKEHA